MAAPRFCTMCDGLSIDHCLGSDGSLSNIDDLRAINKKTGLVTVVIKPTISPLPALGPCGLVPRTIGIRALVLGMSPVQMATLAEVQGIGLLQLEAESLLLCQMPGQNSADELAALCRWSREGAGARAGLQLGQDEARQSLQAAHERWLAEPKDGGDEETEEESAMELYLRTRLQELS
mmetsp:Transcript_40064/g.72647  ORF Transcript_40064/g.72647 Transcript_40064/m.72647 type:complete len:178 (-) Transcript_40064:67-600(-)